MKTLYTAEATVSGGREGQAETSDGRLRVDLDRPAEMGGDGGPGTNPEQLFAAGYAACFQSALALVAQRRQIEVGDSTITARVGLGPTDGGGFNLTVDLAVTLPAVERERAESLVEAAHQVCPYSNATRGNIDVNLSVTGAE